MGYIYESLKQYFENTPKEVLDKDWKEIEPLNEIGPDVIEFAKFVKENFGIFMNYSSSNCGLTHKFNVPQKFENENIPTDAQFYYAA